MTSYLPLLTDDELGTAGEAGVGALATERGNLPLEAIDVDATLTGLVGPGRAHPDVRQPARRSRWRRRYIFPLPDRAAVTGSAWRSADAGGRGRAARSAAQARADYDRAIAAGPRASIAEEERPDVFTMRVGNILPGERVTRPAASGRPAALRGRRGHLPVPAGGGAPLHPGRAAARASRSGDGHRARHRRGARRLADHPAGAAARLPQPGAACRSSVEIDPAGLTSARSGPACTPWSSEERDGVRTVRVEPGERADRDFVLRLRTGSAVGDRRR